MSVIGYATLQVIPSVRGLQGALQSELSGAGNVGGVAGQQLGQGVAGRFRSAIGGLMESAGRAITSAATGVGLVAGTALGVSLFKGFDRVTTIQDATRALTLTLRDATKAGDLLAQVLKIVTGTPFALDQFAAAAQQLVGFGVAAEKVPGILTAVADAAATQGKRAGEFAGQLTDVFGQIAAKGRVQLQDVWRISLTGVNALAILSNHFGVTTEAMQKLIEKGAVPAGVAIDALVKGIEEGTTGIAGQTVALGGLAQTLGTTLSGSLANLKIAFSRFGASIIEPLTGPLTSFFQKMREGIDSLGKRFGAAVKTLAASPGFTAFVDWLTTIPARMGPVIAALGDLGPALAPLAAAFSALALTGVGNLLGPLGAILPAINPVFAAIAALIATQPALREAFGRLVTAIRPLLAQLGPIFVQVLSSAASVLVAVLVPAIDAVSSVLEFLNRNQDVLAAVLVGLSTAIGAVVVPMFIAWATTAAAAAVATFAAAAPFIALGVVAAAVALVIIKNWDKIKGAFIAVFEWVKSNWPLLLAILAGPFGLAVLAIVKNFDTIRDFISGVFSAIASAAAAGWAAVVAVFNAAVALVRAIIDNAFRVILGIATLGLSELLGVIVRNWSAIVSATGSAVSAVIGFFTGLPGAVASGVVAFVEVIAQGVSAVVRFFVSLPGLVLGALGALVSAVVSAFVRLKNDAIAAALALVAFVRGLPGQIVGAFGNAGTLLLGVGKAIIQGLINGLKSLAGGAVDAAKGVAGNVVNGVKGLFGIGSPSKVFAEIGRNVVKGFALGIEKNSGLAQRAMDSLTPSTVFRPFDVAASSAASGGSSVPAGLAGGTFVIHSPVNIDGREVARSTVRFTSQELENYRVGRS